MPDDTIEFPFGRLSGSVPDAPLQHLAALGEGRSVALVGPDGAITWWCVPNMDSPPLFDRLLNPAEGGFFQLCPAEPFRMDRAYRRDSNVLETVFTTTSGQARVTESLNSSLAGRLPWSELARRVEVLSGRMSFTARAVFGTWDNRATPWLQPNSNGCIFHMGGVLGLFRCSANVEMTEETDRVIAARMTLGAGERAVVAILAGADEPLGVPAVEEIDARIEVSDGAWRAWAESLQHDSPHRTLVRRSALALKLLLFSSSGAIAAAATTSLPERVGGNKNYDYRYAWMRDGAYTVNAFLRLGAVAEAKAGFTWLMYRLAEHGPRVMYTLSGGLPPEVEELEELPGYAGSRPVVVGNAATGQWQHGVFGDIMETAALFVARGGVLDQQSTRLLADLVDSCADRWQQKDAGMWELQEARHYTMSKVSAWQALDRGVQLAERGHLPATCVERWERERDRVRAWVDEHCWSEARSAYTFYPGTDRLDASLVLAARFGFGEPARMSATLDVIRAELGRGPYLYRYSGAEAEEGVFLACSFWLAEAYATLGRQAEAEAVFKGAVANMHPGVGIMSEMLDVDSGDYLGNIPQGLSHLALIHAACSMGDDRERPFSGPADLDQASSQPTE